MDKNEMVKGFSQNDAVVILKTNGGTIQGYLSKIDLAQDCFVIQVAVYIGLDGKVERQDLVECKFGDVDTISKFGNEPKNPPTFDTVLKQYPIGKYLMIWGKHDSSTSPTIEQGVLKSINWDKRTLVLHSITYDQDRTVNIGRISFIDDTRSGPGAVASAQTSDWHLRPDGAWYRGEQKYASS
ncbi:hypothetical protein [Lysobacter gummosus]|uniref:Uncharacterized protein n=1 Tax=Lysobacter gummosus TaxID=262324 RepID=A0ABY3XFG0_9GAMM|nr:hypothetical protein [Lysobacter gummosus]ALN89770.1 hypothetical protein LG3211_0788 [Lysobacter gummosus]UNP30378.1 hypothetical protein MOV92_03620 [Lysobacter gummosus]